MTVTITKPPINIREKLTESSAIVPYEQRQFHFDNLITNGTFDTDVSGWTAGNGATLASVSGQIQITSTGSGYGQAIQAITTVVGKTYSVEAERSNGFIAVGTVSAGTDLYTNGYSSSPVSAQFTAESTTTYITLQNDATGSGVQTWDNVSVYEIDPSDNKVIHTMPKGWKPLHVYEDGSLQREGSAYDYTVEYDGFSYIVKETVAPVAPYSTTVIGVRA